MISANKLEGLILAAGYSSRFNFKDRRFNKYLLKLNNSNILGYIIAGMIKTGIEKILQVLSDAHHAQGDQVNRNLIDKIRDSRTVKGSSSIGRVPVSKTGCWGFESLLPCQFISWNDSERNRRGIDED